MTHNSKINDFVAAVEAVNDGEITVGEMHDAYSNSHGYLDCDVLARLEYFADQIAAVIELAQRTRNAQ